MTIQELSQWLEALQQHLQSIQENDNSRVETCQAAQQDIQSLLTYLSHLPTLENADEIESAANEMINNIDNAVGIVRMGLFEIGIKYRSLGVKDVDAIKPSPKEVFIEFSQGIEGREKFKTSVKSVKDEILVAHFLDKNKRLNEACDWYLDYLRDEVNTHINKNLELYIQYNPINVLADDNDAQKKVIDIDLLSNDAILRQIASNENIPGSIKTAITKYQLLSDAKKILNRDTVAVGNSPKQNFDDFVTQYQSIKPTIELRRNTTTAEFLKWVESVFGPKIAAFITPATTGQILTTKMHALFPAQKKSDDIDSEQSKNDVKSSPVKK